MFPQNETICIRIFLFPASVFFHCLSRAETVALSQEEIEATLSFGPWPLAFEKDPSNKVSGDIDAIRLGRKMFFSTRFSKSGETSCATCHEPENGFAERKPRAELATRIDRNTQSLLNVKFHRWFGWDGSHDNLWAQSFAPLLKSSEMDLPPEQLLQILKSAKFRSEYSALFWFRRTSIQGPNVRECR